MLLGLSVIFVLMCMGISGAVGSGQGNEQFAQVLTDNEKLLHDYAYKQRTEVKYDGEDKVVRVAQVRYEPDGKRQVTPLDDGAGDAAGSSKLPKGPLRRAKAKGQQDKLKDYAERLTQLFEGYFPLNPQKLRASFSSAENQPQANGIGITFKNYFKTGDALELLLEPETHKIRKVEITSSLDDDPVTATAEMAAAPNGARYPIRTQIKAPKKKLEIHRTVYDLQKE